MFSCEKQSSLRCLHAVRLFQWCRFIYTPRAHTDTYHTHLSAAWTFKSSIKIDGKELRTHTTRGIVHVCDMQHHMKWWILGWSRKYYAQMRWDVSKRHIRIRISYCLVCVVKLSISSIDYEFRRWAFEFFSLFPVIKTAINRINHSQLTSGCHRKPNFSFKVFS